jgi:hypothetical protein
MLKRLKVYRTVNIYMVSRWELNLDTKSLFIKPSTFKAATPVRICRQAGMDVQYVAEQFENDGSPVSTIVKGVKRAMAGEYIVESFFNLLKDENFGTLLRAEGLNSMPEALADMIKNREKNHA